MTNGAIELRKVLAGPGSVVAAPVFDPLSTRLAAMRGWKVCKLSGSVWKAAELAQPDDLALANMSDLVDIARRIIRVADVALIVDADDAGPSAVNVLRTVRELEAVGVAGIEIEDNRVPTYFGQVQTRHDLTVGIDEQVGKLEAAVAARRDESTVITARIMTKNLSSEELLARVTAYAKTGVDAFMLAGLGPPRDGRADIEAIRKITDLPICELGLPREVESDAGFLDANAVRVRYVKDFPLFRIAVQGINDALACLESGDNPSEILSARMAGMDVVRDGPDAVNGSQAYRAWSQRFVRV
jgi:2-methylisocitrate lyase-like PEP mutase family enzyme